MTLLEKVAQMRKDYEAKHVQCAYDHERYKRMSHEAEMKAAQFAAMAQAVASLEEIIKGESDAG